MAIIKRYYKRLLLELMFSNLRFKTYGLKMHGLKIYV
jgi:hypothetical protein